MKSFIPYYFSVLFFLLSTSLKSQCYRRISLIGGSSVQIITKTVVSKPKSKDEYNKPFTGIQFQRKGNLISIQAINIKKDAYLKLLNPQSYPMSLIEYTREYYAPIDSTCILFDTLKTGILDQQYSFVDLLQIDEFYHTYSNCTENLLNYSCIKERLVVMDDYLYIFSVQAVQNCQSSNHGMTSTTKAVQNDFRRLIHSIKLPKKSKI